MSRLVLLACLFPVVSMFALPAVAQTDTVQPSALIGGWAMPEEMGGLSLAFESAERLVFDGEPFAYSLGPGVLRVRDASGTEDVYELSLEGDLLVLTPPGEDSIVFLRTGGSSVGSVSGTIDDSVPVPEGSTDAVSGAAVEGTGGGSGDAPAGGGAPGTGSAPQPGEIGDPAWGFRLRPPPDWVATRVEEWTILQDPTGRGVIGILPHRHQQLSEVRATMEAGISEGATMLAPEGGIAAFGRDGLVADLVGYLDGRSVKARGFGTISPYGGGAFIVAAIEPTGYDDAWKRQAESVARSIVHVKVERSAVTDRFIGLWCQPGSGKHKLRLAADGSFVEILDSSFVGSTTDSYGETSSIYSNVSQTNRTGRWSVSGDERSGRLSLTYDDGSEGGYSYEGIRVEEGYWTECRWNGTKYINSEKWCSD